MSFKCFSPSQEYITYIKLLITIFIAVRFNVTFLIYSELTFLKAAFHFRKKKKKNNILGNILLKNNCTLLIEEKGAGTRSLTSSVQKDLEFVQSDTY